MLPHIDSNDAACPSCGMRPPGALADHAVAQHGLVRPPLVMGAAGLLAGSGVLVAIEGLKLLSHLGDFGDGRFDLNLLLLTLLIVVSGLGSVVAGLMVWRANQMARFAGAVVAGSVALASLLGADSETLLVIGGIAGIVGVVAMFLAPDVAAWLDGPYAMRTHVPAAIGSTRVVAGFAGVVCAIQGVAYLVVLGEDYYLKNIPLEMVAYGAGATCLLLGAAWWDRADQTVQILISAGAGCTLLALMLAYDTTTFPGLVALLPAAAAAGLVWLEPQVKGRFAAGAGGRHGFPQAPSQGWAPPGASGWAAPAAPSSPPMAPPVPPGPAAPWPPPGGAPPLADLLPPSVPPVGGPAGFPPPVGGPAGFPPPVGPPVGGPVGLAPPVGGPVDIAPPAGAPVGPLGELPPPLEAPVPQWDEPPAPGGVDLDPPPADDDRVDLPPPAGLPPVGAEIAPAVPPSGLTPPAPGAWGPAPAPGAPAPPATDVAPAAGHAGATSTSAPRVSLLLRASGAEVLAVGARAVWLGVPGATMVVTAGQRTEVLVQADDAALADRVLDVVRGTLRLEDPAFDLQPSAAPMPERAPAAASPEGWYPDPFDAAGVRWWDGATWTARAAPLDR